MCSATAWRAWWWRGGKASFERKRRTERLSGDLHAIRHPAGQLHFAVIQKKKSDENEASGPKPRHSVSHFIFRGETKFEPARPAGHDSQDRQRRVAQFGENFFFYVAEAVRVGEQQGAGDGNECGENQASACGGDAAGLHTPFEDRQGNDEQREDAVKQDFRILECDPKAVGAERPRLGIAS